MNRHPYLRAYLAGIAVPTVFLMVIVIAFTVSRHLWSTVVPFERVIIFPMAVVPNAWGLWNVLYVFLRARRQWPLGLHGALLPLLLAPAGFALTRLLDVALPPFLAAGFPYGFPVGIAAYYLAWKHLVGFLNELLGVAG